MKFGFHVSAAAPLTAAPERSAATGGSVFQIFVRSPRGGRPAPISDSDAAAFQANMKTFKQAAFYIHAPYYINFASTNNRIRYGSISVVRDDLERGTQLGAAALMTHLGSAGELKPAEAVAKTAEGITKLLDGYKGTTQFLMEMSAGAGAVIGDTFEELAAILKKMKSAVRDRVGICLDTCHMYASGYDLATKAAVTKTFAQFDKIVGLKKLVMIHANDSMFELGKHRDRHEHIGDGFIGKEGFTAIVNHPKLAKVNLILETPDDPKRLGDLKTLLTLQKKGRP